jgi:hypothetical protein
VGGFSVKALTRCILAFVAITFFLMPLALAKSPEWQTAKVVKADSGGSETESVAVPLPGGASVGESSTSSGKHRRGVYWLKTDKYTYVIPNYCKANLVGIQVVALSNLGGRNQNLRRFGQNPPRDR